MFKRFAALIMCLVFLTITSSVFAEDVYITQQGKKYHKQDCRFIANRDTEKISLEQAQAKGLEPCGRCFGNPEEITKTEKETDENEELVYATENGKKYHKPECRLIKNKNATGITLAEAEDRGLTACSKCFSQKQAKAK